MRKFIISTTILISFIFVSNVRAVLGDEEGKIIISRVKVNTVKQHKYNSLYQSSERYDKHRTFNFLSSVTRGAVVVTSIAATFFSFIPQEDRPIASGILSSSTLILVALDEYLKSSAKHYAEAPDRLQQFLESEAAENYPRGNINEIEKIQVKKIVEEEYESRLKNQVQNPSPSAIENMRRHTESVPRTVSGYVPISDHF